ncbi:MAG: calcium-binding protein [Rhodobacteraceae bacterium]|nr:calcium-binding protein [Paracoccaceae bacterium]
MPSNSVHAVSSGTISEEMFGGHFMIYRTTVDPEGPMARLMGMLGYTNLRYPGGTVTEEFFSQHTDTWDQIFSPTDAPVAKTLSGEVLTKVTDVFHFAAERDLGIQFVLPTNQYFDVAADGTRTASAKTLEPIFRRVDEMIRGVHGPARIEVFQIGNEYFYHDRMTASEYGLMANEMAKGLQRIFDNYRSELGDSSDWIEPRISVQAGVGWQPGDNEAIIASLDAEARAAIDTVATHYYPPELPHVGHFHRHFANLRAWQEEDGFGELNLYVSEWNVFHGPTNDKGLMQASTFAAAFEDLVENGVTEASVWGGQHKFLDTRLATLSHNPQDGVPQNEVVTTLTATGEVFRMMRSSLVGSRLGGIELDEVLESVTRSDGQSIDPKKSLLMQSFKSDDRSTFFVSSRENSDIQISLDFQGVVGDFTHVWAQRLSVADNPATNWVNEGDPTHHLARPIIFTYNEDQLASSNFTFDLGPYEIVKLSFTTGEVGVNLRDFDQIVDPALNYDDHLIGSQFSDFIKAHLGDNILDGRDGDDWIEGGVGNDTMLASGGRNVFLTGGGNNTVELGRDVDLVVSDGGSNTVAAAGPKNVIISRSESLKFTGSDGNDTVFALGENNELTGGGGSNSFYVSVDSTTIIDDFNLDAGDVLSFFGHYSSPDELLARIEATDLRDDGTLDLVVFHDTGATTAILGAGAFISEFIGGFLDFQDDALRAQRVSDTINALSSDQITALLDSLSSEELRDWLDCDPVILLSSLDAGSSSSLMNALNAPELLELLDEATEEGFVAALSEYSDLELALFFSELSDASMELLESWLDPQLFDELIARVPAHFLETAEGADMVHDSLLFGGGPGHPSFPGSSRFSDDESFSAMSLPGLNGSRLHGDVPSGGGEGPSAESMTAALLMMSGRVVDEDAPYRDEEEADDFVAASTCFVASVAYRDREHPDVVFLRWWRDNFLKQYILGRAFIRFYWMVGPRLARYMYRRRRLSGAARSCLSMVVMLLQKIHSAHSEA